jgi:hypothetical protein
MISVGDIMCKAGIVKWEAMTRIDKCNILHILMSRAWRALQPCAIWESWRSSQKVRRIRKK